MTIEAQDLEFRHPEAVAFLRSLTDEQAAKQPPLVLEHDGVVAHYWREGGRVRCREVEASVGSSSGTGALHAFMRVVEAEFSRSLPRLDAELRGGGVPDLDAIEASIRDGLLDCGTALYAALLEALGAELPSPPCPDCGRRMERHSRAGKTFQARMGPVRIERSYCYCRECGTGFHQLDRTLGLEGRTATPGAESLYADVASSESYGQARRKLRNLAGVDVDEDDAPAPCGGDRRGDAGVRAGGRRGVASGEAGSAGDRRYRSPDGRPRGRGGGRQAGGRHGEDPRGEGRRLPRGRPPGSEGWEASERPEERGRQRPHRQRAGGERGQSAFGVRRPPGAVRAPERRARGRGGGCAVRRGAVDPDRLRGGSCPDGKRPSSSTCTTPSNMRPPPCRR